MGAIFAVILILIFGACSSFEHKPLYKDGNCVYRLKPSAESWEEKGIESSFKIKQVGKKEYLVTYWYGMQGYENLVNKFDHGVDIEYIDATYLPMNCESLKLGVIK